MKKVALLCFLTFACIYAYSQELPNLKHVKLNKRASFKNSESLVLKVVSYLFETPIDKNNKSRTEAGQFLINWMNGTPDYTFYLDEKETEFFNTDSDFILMYMAGLTKYTIEHPEIKNQKTIVLGALKFVLPYLYQQSDKKNWSKDLWQLYDANQNGKLETYLYN
jgi:hypothetical protein